MKFTRQHRREARQLWQTVTVGGIPDAERIRKAVQAVRVQGGRGAEPVLKCFAERLSVYIRSTQVTAVSAAPLSSAQQTQLSRLADGGPGSPGIRFVVDPAVIGGLRLEQGYQVTDRTVARQLEVLQEVLLNMEFSDGKAG